MNYKRSFCLLFISVLMSAFCYATSADELNDLHQQAVNAYATNDLATLKVIFNKVFTQNNKNTKADLTPFYMLRAKYFKALSQNKSAENDVDTVLKYSPKTSDAYLLKIEFIKDAESQIALLQKGIDLIDQDEPLRKQAAMIKIGMISSYWDMKQYNSEPFIKDEAYKKFPVAKGACNDLLQLTATDQEAMDLYKKKCKIEDIKNF